MFILMGGGGGLGFATDAKHADIFRLSFRDLRMNTQAARSCDTAPVTLSFRISDPEKSGVGSGMQSSAEE